MSTVKASDPPRLDIAGVLQDTFDVMIRNVRVYAPAALLLGGLPRLLAGLVGLGGPHNPLIGLLTFGVSLGAGFCSLLLTGALIHNASSDLEGMPEPLGTSLSSGINNWLVLLGSTLVSAICIALGGLLLIVPGIMIGLAWCVAGPAVIIEGRGVGASLQRSADLTRHRRWAILGYLILLWVGVGLIESLLVSATGGAIGIRRNPLSLFLIQPLVSMVNTPLAAASCTVLFHRLRVLHEGGAPEALSDVFV